MPLAVVDAWAMLAWLGHEAGAATVDRWLERSARAGDPLLMSVINAGEVFYRLSKGGEPDRAEEFSRDVRRRVLPLQLMPATNPRVWRSAALKGRYAIAYADAFAASLGAEFAVPVLTGDPDFAPLQADGVCKVVWIPS
jgi:PIN domain nuclease of toxin-antitoxin system